MLDRNQASTLNQPLKTMLFRYLTLLALIARDVFADVQFVTPAPGASIASGGKTLLVSWAESGEAPPLASLTTYTLFLCAGGNDAASQVRERDDFAQISFVASLMI